MIYYLPSFLEHLEQGTLSMLSKDIETSLPLPFSIMLIYKNAPLADLNELVLCIEKSLKETQLEDRLELDRRIGQLLGYSTQDIEFYIQHVSNFLCPLTDLNLSQYLFC